MKKILLAVFAVVLLASASISLGLELNSAGPVVGVASGTAYAAVDSSTNVYQLPTAYMIWAKVATDAPYVRRNFAGTWEKIPFLIPAGQSLVVSAPNPVLTSAGYYVHRFEFTAHTDSIYIMPWKN